MTTSPGPPPLLDPAAGSASMRARRDAGPAIGASGMRVPGGLCLQPLLAAQRSCGRAGLPHLAPRLAFVRALARFGATPAQPEGGEQG